MKTFTINKKVYMAKEFDFNTICELQELGLNMDEMGKKPMAFMRAYLSMCGNMSVEEAGNEIQAQIVSGGKLDDLQKAFADAVSESDFFRAINENTAEKAGESESQSKKK